MISICTHAFSPFVVNRLSWATLFLLCSHKLLYALLCVPEKEYFYLHLICVRIMFFSLNILKRAGNQQWLNKWSDGNDDGNTAVLLYHYTTLLSVDFWIGLFCLFIWGFLVFYGVSTSTVTSSQHLHWILALFAYYCGCTKSVYLAWFELSQPLQSLFWTLSFVGHQLGNNTRSTHIRPKEISAEVFSFIRWKCHFVWWRLGCNADPPNTGSRSLGQGVVWGCPCSVCLVQQAGLQQLFCGSASTSRTVCCTANGKFERKRFVSPVVLVSFQARPDFDNW